MRRSYSDRCFASVMRMRSLNDTGPNASIEAPGNRIVLSGIQKQGQGRGLHTLKQDKQTNQSHTISTHNNEKAITCRISPQ